MDFIYDNAGRPYAIVNGNSKEQAVYYFILNQQGDVIRILGPNNTVAATYAYNAWGEVISSSGWMANQNPIRYRGYFQDNETGFYYLGSRYYDPQIGRFINADETSNLAANGDFTSLNLFAYCGNNPVSRSDNGGEFWNIVIGAAVGALVSAVTTAVDSYQTTGSIDWVNVAISATVGAVSGGVAATGLGAITQAAITAGTTFAGDIATQVFCENKSLQDVNYLKAAHNSVLAGGTSVMGSVLGGITSYGHSSAGKTLVSAGKDKLLTGYVRQSAGQSYSKLLEQGRKLISVGVKHINTARGISSVTGTVLTWGVNRKYSWSS